MNQRLGIERLEDRRVLNGGAVVVVALSATNGQNSEQVQPVVIETGAADGQADVFEVVRGEAEGKDLLQIQVNGSVVYSADFDQVQSISFAGSADQETLFVDFSHGDPIPLGGISFVGQSGTAAVDALVLANGYVDAANYAFSSSTDGQLQLGAGGATTTITFRGSVGTISDTLQATSRTFDLGGTVTEASLRGAADGSAATRLALGQGVGVTFANPTGSLTLQDETAGVLNLNLAGVGSGYNASLTVAGQADAQVYVTGALQVGAHDVDISGGAITVEGSVVSHGGTIHLDAGSAGTVIVTGRLDASNDAAGATGGTIDVLGQRVGLDGAAIIDASGLAGGGLVRIGGDYQGSNPQVHNAERVYVGAGVTISADAIDSGSGGRVIVWSDEFTAFHGRVSARGGAAAGDGGFVEISGAESLVADGTYDLGSTHGVSGTLLFDPQDILIVGGTADGSDNTDASATNLRNNAGSNTLGSILFTDEGAGSPVPFIVYESEIESTNANIILQARQNISVSGTFTNNELVLLNNRSLTLTTRNQTADGAGGIDLTGSTAGNSLLFRTQGTGGITIQGGTAAQATGNVVTGSLTTATGSVAVTSGNGTVTLAGAVQSAAMTVSATAGVTFHGAVTATGALTVNADTNADGVGLFSLATGMAVSTGNNALSITGADIDLGGTLSSGTGTTTLSATAGQTVGLGNAVGQQYTLSGTELQGITAGTLTLGGLNAGNMTVDGVSATQSANIATVNLLATGNGRSLTFSGSASTFKTLSASADNGMVVGADLATNTAALTLNGNADNAVDGNDQIQFAAGTTVSSAGLLTLSSATGGLTGAGTLTLNAVNGITLNQSLTTAGALAFNADTNADGTGTVTIAAGAAVNTGGNSLSLTAADLALSGTFNVGTAGIGLVATAGRTMALGSASGQFAVSGTELQNMTAGTVMLGGATSGNISVRGVTAANSANVGTVQLAATGNGQSLTFTTTSSTFKAVVAQADDGITVATSVTTNTGDLVLDGNANSAADTTDSIQISSGVTLTSAGLLSLTSATGNLNGAGTLTLNAANGVTLNNSLTTAGALTVNADTNADGTGLFSLATGMAVSTGNTALSLTAADIDLGGTLSSGTGTTTLSATAGRTVGVGDAIGQQYTLSGTELQGITAGTLTLGGVNAGNMTVDGVSATQSANIATVNLLATGNGRSLTFSGSASTFKTLSASSDNGMVVGADVTTNTGALTLNGNADNAVDGNDQVQFATGVTTSSAGLLTLSSATGGLTGAGALTLNAVSGIILNQSLTTAGALAFNADTNADGTGTVTIAAGAAVNTGGNSLSVTAADLALSGTFNVGAAGIGLVATAGRTMGLGSGAGQFAVSGTELQNMTAATVVLGGATSGNIAVSAVTAANSANVGLVDLEATANGRTITFSGSTSTFRALLANADDGMTVSASITTNTGSLVLNGDADSALDTSDRIQFSSGVTLTSAGLLSLTSATGNLNGAGTLTLNAANAVTLNNSLTTAGALTVNADTNADGAGTFSLASGMAVSTGNNALSITAADIDLGGTLSSGTGTTTLSATAGQTVGLGNAVGQQYTLSGAELQGVTAATLTLGGVNAGNMTVDGVTALQSAGISTVNLLATGNGRSLTFSGSASTFKTLSASGDNGMVVGADVATSTGALTLNGNADNAVDGNDQIQFAAGTTVSSAGLLTLSSATGGLTGAGALALNAATGITLNQSLTTVGALAFNADTNADGTGTVTIASGAAVNTGGNSLSVTAADLALSGSFNVGAAGIGLVATAGRTMGLGSGAGQFSVSGTELQNMTAGTVVLGGATSGNITVGGVSTANSANVAVVDLEATANGRTVTFSGSTSTFRTVTANADDGMTVSAGVTTNTGSLTFNGNADNSADSSDRIQFSSGVTLTSAGLLSLTSATGNLNGAGTLTLNASTGVTLNNSLTTAGALTVNADTNADGVGTFSLAASMAVSTGNTALSITAADIDLGGTLSSGTGTTTLSATAGRTVGVGDAMGQQYALSGTELQGISAGTLTLGGVNAGNMTVDGVTALQSAGITTVNLLVTGNGRSLTFSGGASTFKTLSASADNGMVVGADLATNTGALTLNGNADNAVDGNDQVQFAAGVTTSSAGLLTLSSATGGLTGAGALTFNAATGITVNQSLTTAGALAFNADTNADGTGTVTIAAGAAVNTGGNSLSVTAADLALSGSLSSGAARTIVQNSSSGRAIRLGGTVAGQLSITDAELDRITTGILQIGRRDLVPSGQITVSSAIGPAGTSILRLITAADIVESGGSVSVANLALEADGNIAFNGANALATLSAQAGGSVDVRVTGGLTVGTVDGISGIVAAGANVVIESSGSMTLAEVIVASAAEVSLQSDSGGIVDGNGSATNVFATRLALQAASGIGSTNALETSVGLLAALNNSSGNIEISNDATGGLSIGTVGAVSGMQNAGGGSILVSSLGGLTVNSRVAATGGSGNIDLTATGDLVIQDSGLAVDIEAQNAGQILGIAGQQVVFGPNVVIQTGTGAIVTLSPALDDVVMSPLAGGTTTHLTGTFGNPGAHGFEIVVDWGDGAVATYQFADPGTFDFAHVYTGGQQAVPLVITVTVFDDAHSHFIGYQQPATTTPLSPTEFKTVANGFASVLLMTTLPPFFEEILISIDTRLEIPQRQVASLTSLEFTPVSVPAPVLAPASDNSVIAGVLPAAIPARHLIHEVLDEQGNTLEQEALDVKVLEDLPAYLRQLPNGRHRLLLQEPGETAPHPLLDIYLKDGAPTDATQNAREGAAGKAVDHIDEGRAAGSLRPQAEPAASRAEAADHVAVPIEAARRRERSAAGPLDLADDWGRRVDSLLTSSEAPQFALAARLTRRMRQCRS